MDARRILPIAIPLLVLSTAGPVKAQIRGSEAAVVAQTIDGTTLTIEYSRPRAAGRVLFGELVAFDEPWTGANWATTLDVNREIQLNGTVVPAGKYSLWWVPRSGAESWTLILDPEWQLFHFQKPGPSPEQIRVTAEPRQASHLEVLTWSFPAIAGDAAMLQMQWGTTAVPLQVIVQPTRPVTLAPDERAGFIGTFDLEIVEDIGWPTSARFEIHEAGDMLRGRLPFPIHPGDDLEFDLIPAGRDQFSPGIYRDGRLFNIEMGATFEFEVERGRATAVRLRAIEGSVLANGRRAQTGS